MECVKIRKLLSEHVDGLLDAKTTIQVERHLSACSDCRKQFAALKMLVDDLGALPSVQAPPDFLVSLHRRLESEAGSKAGTQTGLGRMWRKLFIPWRVKIPMQLVSAAAVATLVIAIYHVQQPQLEMESAVSPPHEVVRKKSIDQDSRLTAAPALPRAPAGEMREPDRSMAVASRQEPEKAKAPIELALVLRPHATFQEFTSSFAAKEQVPPSEHARDRNGLDQAASSQANIGAGSRYDASQGERAMADTAPKHLESGPAPLSPNQFLWRINRLIQHYSGNVTSIEKDQQTGQASEVLAQIPYRQYGAFIAALKRFGDLKSLSDVQPDADQQIIAIRIRLLLPASDQ
jgi:hypothetical protein